MKAIPFLSPIILAIFAGVLALMDSRDLETSMLVFCVLAVVGSFVLIISSPLILLRNRKKEITISFMAILGGTMAFLANLLVGIYIFPPRVPTPLVNIVFSEMSLFVVLYGVATGALFWLIRKFTGPNKRLL